MKYSVWLRGETAYGKQVKVRVYGGKQRNVSEDLFAKLSACVDIFGLSLTVTHKASDADVHTYPLPPGKENDHAD